MTDNKNIIFGIRSVIEGIKSGKEIDKVLLKKGLTGELVNELLNLMRSSQVPFQFVPGEKINSITTKNHQGVVAIISQITYQNIELLIPTLYESGKVPLILVLDHITDVRNFGAIARTAECAGVDAIIIPSKGAAQVNSDAIKTSAGALHTIPVCRVDSIPKTIRFLKDSGITTVAATEKAVQNYTEHCYKEPVAIILGSEETGIGNESLKLTDSMVKIPITGKIESLNVSVANGVILYEVLRQRSIN